MMFNVQRGIGDQLCAEPTVRWYRNYNRSAKILVRTDYPEFFAHLDVDLTNEPIPENPSPLQLFYTHCIDWHSLNMLGIQLCENDRRLRYVPEISDKIYPKKVVLHPGRNDSLPLKNIPSNYWQQIIDLLCWRGITPTVVGADGPGTGVMDLDLSRCENLVNQTTLEQTAIILQTAQVVVTNDSSAYHLASAGDAKILLLSTWKNPAYLSHWRRKGRAHNTRVISRGGFWQTVNHLGKGADEFQSEWLLPIDYVMESIDRMLK